MTAAAQALAAQATTGAEATGQAAQAPETPANLPEWANGVAPEVGAWLLNKQFADPQAALTSSYHLERMLGQDKIPLPKDASDKAGWDAVWSKLGRPEKPEDYGLPVPDGDDGEFAKVAAGVFHKAGVPKGMAGQIASAINEHVAGAMKARSDALQAEAAGAAQPLARVVAQALSISLLNPHVYLDTVLLVGSIGAQQPAGLRPWFVAGASVASMFWFTMLGFGARWLAPWFARPRAWQVLDALIGLTKWVLALLLFRHALAGL